MTAPVNAGYCSGSNANKLECVVRDVFQPNSTTTWRSSGNANVLAAAALSNYAVDKGTAQPFGLNNIGLGATGSTSLVMADRILAETDSKDFSNALFGLSNLEANLGGLSAQSFLRTLVDASLTASLSFGYTAGFYGVENWAPPSLILGGYDASRIDVSTTMSVNITNSTSMYSAYQFAVNLTTIWMPGDIGNPYSIVSSGLGSGGAQISDSPLTVYIDSTTPYIWLPPSICELFEITYHLEWNETAQLYLMNASTHEALLQNPLNVTFFLSSPNATNTAGKYTLSSLALGLRATWPLVDTDSYYFPLKRASGISVLGRVFLQETYIVTDYDRGYFNLSQISPYNGQKDLRTILNATYAQWAETDATPRASRLSPAVHAGIAIAIFAAVVCLASLVAWKRKWWPFNSKPTKDSEFEHHEYVKAELHGQPLPWVEVMGVERVELRTRECRHEIHGPDNILKKLQSSIPVHELQASEPSRDIEDPVADGQQR
jgi:hypothetical protein